MRIHDLEKLKIDSEIDQINEMCNLLKSSQEVLEVISCCIKIQTLQKILEFGIIDENKSSNLNNTSYKRILDKKQISIITNKLMDLVSKI